jgi:ATP citrate (pro-S)-lyase
MIQDLSDFGFKESNGTIENMDDRKHALISSSISKDVDGEVQILGEDLLSLARNNGFAKIIASMFLGKKIQSQDTEELVDFILRISVDHGPYVSGALNTIVSARAGKDLVSSLSSGLLTIGPRSGGK